MLQFDEYKGKLNNLRPGLDELEQALGLEAAQREVDMLESESASDGFWDNLEKAQKVQQRISILRGKLEGQAKRRSQWNDLMALCEMGNEFEDESLIPELEEGYGKLEEEVEEAKLTTLLTGEYDSANAILTFHAGQAVPRPRIGPKCFTACIPVGRNATALPIRSWTIWTETRRGSRVRPS